jgi:hypothetical protein
MFNYGDRVYTTDPKYYSMGQARFLHSRGNWACVQFDDFPDYCFEYEDDEGNDVNDPDGDWHSVPLKTLFLVEPSVGISLDVIGLVD